MCKLNCKWQIVAIIFLTCIMTILLAGCNKSIEFEVLEFNPNIKNDYVSGAVMNTVNCVSSREELERLYDNDYFNDIDLTAFNQFDDKYFQDNALLILCFAGDKSNVLTVKDIFIRNNELFVSISSGVIKKLTMYHYKYIKISQTALKNATKFSYIYKTI